MTKLIILDATQKEFSYGQRLLFNKNMNLINSRHNTDIYFVQDRVPAHR